MNQYDKLGVSELYYAATSARCFCVLVRAFFLDECVALQTSLIFLDSPLNIRKTLRLQYTKSRRRLAWLPTVVGMHCVPMPRVGRRLFPTPEL